MTKEQAIKLLNSKFWETMSFRDRAMFQMFEDRLCMPFDVFHEAVEKALGRPVWTHEFGLNIEGLKKELLGEQGAPTMQQIIELIPKEKRVLVVSGDDCRQWPCECDEEELSCGQPCDPLAPCAECVAYWDRMIREGFWDKKGHRWTDKGWREITKWP